MKRKQSIEIRTLDPSDKISDAYEDFCASCSVYFDKSVKARNVCNFCCPRIATPTNWKARKDEK